MNRVPLSYEIGPDLGAWREPLATRIRHAEMGRSFHRQDQGDGCRNLSASQRALVAAAFLDYERGEAKKRAGPGRRPCWSALAFWGGFGMVDTIALSP